MAQCIHITSTADKVETDAKKSRLAQNCAITKHLKFFTNPYETSLK